MLVCAKPKSSTGTRPEARGSEGGEPVRGALLPSFGLSVPFVSFCKMILAWFRLRQLPRRAQRSRPTLAFAAYVPRKRGEGVTSP